MTVLFGHPTGNPNSHHAALAHFEAGRLEAFCVPWMPSELSLRMLSLIPGTAGVAKRLSRRRFCPLTRARLVQGRLPEWARLAQRLAGHGDEGLSYEANDWLMRTMARECTRTRVTAVHAYEDCSLVQFEAARRLGKACIYDLPIGFHAAWQRARGQLIERFRDWLPPGGLPADRFARPQQKDAELALADIVMVPSAFVERTVLEFDPSKRVCRAPYGVDTAFWDAAPCARPPGPLRFICAGQLSLRKGTPLLLEAWRAAGLRDSRLELVGPWQLAHDKRASLPEGATVAAPCAPEQLRERFRAADVFVLPSFFEGLALTQLEALACGLPVITTDASGADHEMLPHDAGRVLAAGDLEALVETLRWFERHRDALPAMRRAARTAAQELTWQRYRARVTAAVAPYV